MGGGEVILLTMMNGEKILVAHGTLRNEKRWCKAYVMDEDIIDAQIVGDYEKRFIAIRDLDGAILTSKKTWSEPDEYFTPMFYRKSANAIKALKLYGAPLIGDEHFQSRGKVIAVNKLDYVEIKIEKGN
jgi:hypothetical protein